MDQKRGARALWILGHLMMAACAHPAPPAVPPPSSPSRMLDAELPSFKRPTLQGGTFDSSSATGRLLVIDFFAAYCRPCQRKLPELEALHRQRPELSIVGVSLDDTPDAAWKSVARHHLTFPVVHDSGNVLAGRLRVTELPVSFVVDGQGRIRWVGGPDQPEDAVARVVAALKSSP